MGAQPSVPAGGADERELLRRRQRGFSLLPRQRQPEQGSNLLDGAQQAAANLDPGNMPSPPRREAREREILHAFGELGAAKEVRFLRAFAQW